jgi:type I restriction enzyme S subunit
MAKESARPKIRSPWLADIPSGWAVVPLAWIARFVGGGTPSKEVVDYWNGDIPWVSPKDMKGELLTDSEDHLTDAGLAASATTVIPSGSVLMVMRSGILKHTLPVAINAVACTLNQDMRAVDVRPKLNPKFLLRFVQGFNNELLASLVKQGATVESIDADLLRLIEVPVPPKAEQDSLVAYLDRETARIDALIEKKTRFIELLREKRQALITQAVTQGLDLAVPMKDSGVEWLGQVPAHWDVAQIRHVARLGSGHTPSREVAEYWVDCDIPWFTLADVWQIRQEGKQVVNETEEKISALGVANSAATVHPAGSVLLSRTASVGFAAIMGRDMATSQDFAVWTCGPLVHNEYLYYVLLGMAQEFVRVRMGSTHKTIYMPDIEAFKMPVPPVAEQRAIASRLADELKKNEALLAVTHRSIALLKERRSALITAAVTGQIDLREAA